MRAPSSRRGKNTQAKGEALNLLLQHAVVLAAPTLAVVVSHKLNSRRSKRIERKLNGHLNGEKKEES